MSQVHNQNQETTTIFNPSMESSSYTNKPRKQKDKTTVLSLVSQQTQKTQQQLEKLLAAKL
jgi:hypothetical protein